MNAHFAGEETFDPNYFDRAMRDWWGPQAPNTFRLRPEPRPGYVDARRADGCVPCITVVPA